jgi:endonuclease/exonuclease/phosphatase family metal-dependent hydrolase
VASLNLHRGFGFFGQAFDVAAALCQLEAEVVCVQESWLADAAEVDELAQAAAKLGATGHRAVMFRPDSVSLPEIPATSGPGEISIAVLSALPVSDYQVIDLGRAPGDVVPRLAQVLTLKLAGGTTARIVNTHLTHRLTSPLQLRKLHQRLRAHGQRSGRVPTVIVGDLNMPRPFAAMSITYDTTVRGKTWPAARPLVQLDHILVDQSFRVIESAVLPSAGSDHLPIRARLGVLALR